MQENKDLVAFTGDVHIFRDYETKGPCKENKHNF